jgi:predicted DNA-binding transcriptional regulator YafY
MRSDRLLSLLLLLQARNPRNARELSTALEVSQRTIYRDVEALAAAGVPIYAERGSTGGIALVEGYRQSLAHFTLEELHALFLASAQPLHDLGVAGAGIALDKLSGALSEAQRANARKARERILLDQNKWYRNQQPAALLATLYRAVWDDQRIRLQYRDRTGTTTERVVEPLGLVSKAGIWYLVAGETGSEPHTFRAERIVDAEALPERFDRPAGFDLEQHWHASTRALEKPVESFEVTVRVRGAASEALGYWEAEMLTRGAEGEGDIYRLRFPGRNPALYQVMTWGERVEILEPASLREAALERAREVVALYGGGVAVAGPPPGQGSAVPAMPAIRPPSGGRSSKYQRTERRSHSGTKSSSA